VLGLLLVACAVLGAPWEAGGITIAVALLGMALRWKYRADLRRAPDGVLPAHRDRLDLIVSGDLRGVALAGIAVSLTMILGDVAAPAGVGTARSVTLTLTAVVACMYVSSLIDWYAILPRVSGQLGARPCRSHLGQQPPTWPKTWRDTTCWWYYHRIATAMAFRLGLGYAIALGVSGVVTFEVGPRLFSAGLLGLFTEYSPLKLKAITFESMHPRLIVGDTVVLVRKERTMRQLKIGQVMLFGIPRKSPKDREVGEREYVFDVSVEGVHVVPARPRETTKRRKTFEQSPPLVRLTEVDEVRDGDPAFSGCENGRCSGINWYCIENPRCFERK
jgi:hypothetical protein